MHLLLYLDSRQAQVTMKRYKPPKAKTRSCCKRGGGLLNAWLGSGFWLAWLACQRRWGFAAAGCALCVLAPGICICPCRCDRRTAVQPLLADRGTVRSRRWA